MSLRGRLWAFFAAGKLWNEYRPLLLGAGLIESVCETAALSFSVACYFAVLGFRWNKFRLLILGAGLIVCESEGAALDFVFADYLLANLRLKRSECRPLLFGRLLARLEV